MCVLHFRKLRGHFFIFARLPHAIKHTRDVISARVTARVATVAAILANLVVSYVELNYLHIL